MSSFFGKERRRKERGLLEFCCLVGYEIKTQEAEPPRRCLVQDLCKEAGVHLAFNGFIHLINLYGAPLLGATCCPEDGDATVNKAGGILTF